MDNQKILKARSRLVANQPFLAVLTLRMPCIPDSNKTPAISTDGYDFFYNEAWVEQAQVEDVQFALASCALHAGLLHTTRRGNRDQDDWDTACDYAVNAILKDCGYPMHKDSLHNPKYAGLAADQIYSLIHTPPPPQDSKQKGKNPPPQGGGANAGGEPSQDEEPQDGEAQPEDGAPSKQDTPEGKKPASGHGKDFSGCRDSQSADRNKGPDQPGQEQEQGEGQGQGQGQGAPSKMSPEDLKELESELKENFAQAIAAGKAAGQLPGDLQRLANEYFNPPQVDWRELLRAYMIKPKNDEYTWNRGNRRYLSQDLYLPTQRGVGSGEVVICIDTSGSLSEQQLQEFADEINDIVETVKPERTYVLYCDTRIQHVDEFNQGEQMHFKAHGGGGTEFEPPFKWINDKGLCPEVFVYCTDGYCQFPKEVTDYPTIWVVNSDVTPPWGEHVPIKSKDRY